MKKTLQTTLAAALFICMAFAFAACAPGGIPNGKYYASDLKGNIAEATKDKVVLKVTFGSATFTNPVSGKETKGKIAKENDKVYFKYETEILGSTREVKHELVYDSETKILTMKSAEVLGLNIPAYILTKG